MAVMMETFLNSLSESLGWSDRLPAIRVFKNIISSGVQAAYLIFSRAVLSLASFSDCVLCLIFFLSITTVSLDARVPFQWQLLDLGQSYVTSAGCPQYHCTEVIQIQEASEQSLLKISYLFHHMANQIHLMPLQVES